MAKGLPGSIDVCCGRCVGRVVEASARSEPSDEAKELVVGCPTLQRLEGIIRQRLEQCVAHELVGPRGVDAESVAVPPAMYELEHVVLSVCGCYRTRSYLFFCEAANGAVKISAWC